MSPKLVLGLAVATLIAVIAAVAGVLTEPGTSRIELDGEPAFQALRADPDAVAEIVIQTAEHQVILRRQEEGGWTAETAHGYRASGDRIRELVTGLADMRLIEPKTANPERFARLEVEDVALEEAASRLVRLTDADGEVLADVIIGKTRNRLTGTEPAGTYIRQAGEQQSWLASGRIELPGEPALWLERRVVDLAADSVASIEVEPPDGPSYLLRREDGRWVMAGEGPEAPPDLSDDADPDDLAGALAALDLRGVRPVDQVDWPEAAWRVRFTTDDGLEVAVRLAEIEGEPWVQLEAGTSLDDADAPAAERAAAISARTEGWAYRLPEQVAARLQRARSVWLDESTS